MAASSLAVDSGLSSLSKSFIIFLVLGFFDVVDNHLDLVVGPCPRCAVAFYDTASVSFIHRLNEYAAAVGECYCEDCFFRVVHNHG